MESCLLRSVVIWGALALFPAQALANDCDVPKWDLQTRAANGKDYDLDSFTREVTVIVYEGQRTKGLNQPTKDAFAEDPEIGAGGTLVKHIDYFGIANYKEILAPQWVVSRYLKRRMKKYNILILEDRDRCFSGTGTSKKCRAGDRKDYFKNKKSNFAILYQDHLVLHKTGKVTPKAMTKYIADLARAAADGRDVCWVSENVKFQE